jgi:hypothetical protein
MNAKIIKPCQVEPVVRYVAVQWDKDVPSILNWISKIGKVYFCFKHTKKIMTKYNLHNAYSE